MFFNSALKARIAELELHLNNSTELSSRKSKEIDKLREDIARRESQIEYLQGKRSPIKAQRMVGIKFSALFDGRYQKTEFKAGLGPCGKDVKWFTVTKDERCIVIHQHHVDGSKKDFEYRLSDIDGRIQYDYEEVTLFGEEAEQERVARQFVVRPRYAL